MKDVTLLQNEIEEYIKRSVVDIARRCYVYDTDVIKIIKKLYGND